MKKAVLMLLLGFFAINSYAQAGDLTIGPKGSYILKYPGFTYGLDVSYQLSDPLEITLSGMMNPQIKTTDKDYKDPTYDRNISIYGGNLDLHFYLLNQETWGMGPAIGFQCASFKVKDPNLNDYVEDEGIAYGVNMGWHIRAELTENLKLNGGWSYTSATEYFSHHTFYLGIGYTFNLF
ncbi:MAG: porin family protein [Candidatus Symbiothrix sp.]|jgi:opacity protein-like surface antigen|nr:porin family protein [Candidatus Symbiothrix sp.]